MDAFLTYSGLLTAFVSLIITVIGFFHRIPDSSEDERTGRRYRRTMFNLYPGRCPECGSRVFTRVLPCTCSDENTSLD